MITKISRDNLNKHITNSNDKINISADTDIGLIEFLYNIYKNNMQEGEAA